MHEAEHFKTYNIAGEERSTLEVVRFILDIVGSDPNIHIKFVQDRPGPDFRYSVEDSKIRRELSWEPQRSYDKAIYDLIDWYTTNKDWWLRIKRKSSFTDYYKKQYRGYAAFGREELPHPGKF